MWTIPLKTSKTDPDFDIETMHEVSGIAAYKLHRRLQNIPEEDLRTRIIDLVLSVYADVQQVSSSALVSWSARDDLTPTDAILCVMDRIVNLNVYGLYHSTSTSDYLNVLGFWEFRQHD